MRRWQSFLFLLSIFVLVVSTVGCRKNDAAADGAGVSSGSGGAATGAQAATRSDRSGGRPGGSGGGRPGGGGPGGWGAVGGGEPRAAVPVEVAPVVLRSISAFLETNGTLEAENDVDLVTRTSGPVVELLVEEGMQVRKGQLLARIDPDEVRARLEIAKVNREDAKIAYDRAKRLREDELLSQEAYDQAKSTYESAEAQLLGEQIIFGYTEIKAPFSGVISRRYIKRAQFVNNNEPLFRVTSFDPLLCPIQVPERELPRLSIGQEAYVTVEAWPEERFPAKVLRLAPVVDSATGTVKVTLEVSASGKLRPGMFTSVYLETETRPEALVIPRAALSLESIGDTVYVAEGESASRREVEIGFQEGDFIEVRSGVEAGEHVIVVGQDGLSDGTPIQVLRTTGAEPATRLAEGPPGGGGERSGGPGGGAPFDVEAIKQRMRDRGMNDEQIEERMQQMRARFGGGSGGAPAAAPGGPGGRGPAGPGGAGRGFDPSNMTEEQLEALKQRMRDRGLDDEQIEERLEQMKQRAAGGSGS